MAKGSQDSIYFGHAISKVYDDARQTLALDVEGNAFLNLTASQTKVVSSSSGVLVGISINTNGGAVALYDGVDVTGTPIGTIATDAPEGFFPLQIAFSTGLVAVTGATVNATVVYRPGSGSFASGSASPSESASISPSASLSPSPSLSPSASGSASSSASLSPSASASASASKSLSPSASASPSGSASKSLSPSASASPSASESASVSPSLSPSFSMP